LKSNNSINSSFKKSVFNC